MSKTTAAEQVVWDLGDLYDSPEDPQLERDLQGSLQRAEGLGERFRGRLAALSAPQLRDLLREYEELLDTSGKAASFAYLAWSTHTEEAARGALLQKLQEHSSQLQQRLLFLELEWASLEEERAQALMRSPELAHYRFWLVLTRRYRPHLLSEPEEKILAEKAVTGRAAWVRFFEEIHSAQRYLLDGEGLPAQTVLSRLLEVEREVRRRAAEALTAGLQSMSRLTTYVLNNILADKASDDRLRRYPSWISARNLGNQIDDATVEALISAVTARYDLVARYYRLKRQLLGLEELFDYDRYAPLPASGRSYTWEEARTAVLESYGEFAPEMGEIAGQFFQRHWIDAAVRPGKRGGAYSHGTVPSVHPYIFMNFQGKPRDVMTLAHEMGHGVHQYLAREQGILLADTPLTTAETASVFGEMLVFQRLMRLEPDPRERLSMLVQKIEDSFATVFRQVAMNRFEQAAHEARRSAGELPTASLNALWRQTQEAMFQGSVSLTESYDIWWSYIPHFIHSPGYVYAYAFGELLVLALYARYQQAGAAFPPAYLRLLRAGGSDWPHELVAPLGVDLKDPDFWKKGLDMIESLVLQAEELAAGV